jgi:hypothetical protein
MGSSNAVVFGRTTCDRILVAMCSGVIVFFASSVGAEKKSSSQRPKPAAKAQACKGAFQKPADNLYDLADQADVLVQQGRFDAELADRLRDAIRTYMALKNESENKMSQPMRGLAKLARYITPVNVLGPDGSPPQLVYPLGYQMFSFELPPESVHGAKSVTVYVNFQDLRVNQKVQERIFGASFVVVYDPAVVRFLGPGTPKFLASSSDRSNIPDSEITNIHDRLLEFFIKQQSLMSEHIPEGARVYHWFHLAEPVYERNILLSDVAPTKFKVDLLRHGSGGPYTDLNIEIDSGEMIRKKDNSNQLLKVQQALRLFAYQVIRDSVPTRLRPAE